MNGYEYEDKYYGDEDKKSKGSLLGTIIFAAVCVFIILFFRYTIVEGSSMDKTLADGQMLIITSFMYEPECGDIVVINSEALGKPIIKRIIAVGGQTVRVTRTEIWVDGVPLDEPYVYIDPQYHAEHGEYFYNTQPNEVLYPILKEQKSGEYYEVTVPEGEIFVLGDHRNNSLDSRILGTIDCDEIIGNAIFRFYPFDKLGTV